MREIDCEKLLLVEGKDEVNITIAILKYIVGAANVEEIMEPNEEELEKDENNKRINVIQNGIKHRIDIKDVGGKEKFRKNIMALVDTTGFSEVRSIGIVRDAEDSKSDTFKSIQGTLRDSDLPIPVTIAKYTDRIPKVGVYISPNYLERGMIENDCLESKKNHRIMDCVDNYFKCIETKVSAGDMPQEIEKAKCQVFLAGMPGKLVKSVGLGALRDYWDFDNKCFNGLVEFIRTLLTL